MIISASRRTDIPNYFSNWFFNRIQEGYVYVRNPINIHQVSQISLSKDVVDCIVFWTKNPKNMLPRLKELDGYPFYFQFTLTGYGKDIEPNLPDKRKELIYTFIELSKMIGRERVIWRYDPVLINERYTLEYHVKAFSEIAEALSLYTQKVVISFIDLYAKTQRNTKELQLVGLKKEDMREIAKCFSEIASQNNLKLETCSEDIDLSEFGIGKGHCIDAGLIEKLIGCKIVAEKDKNQRQECGCIESIDIGAYNTCKNGCRYCYANFNNKCVMQNNELHDPYGPLLYGKLEKEDRLIERKVESCKKLQMSLFDLE